VLRGERERALVAGGQELRLAKPAAAPDRSDGRATNRSAHFRNPATGRDELRTGSVVDRPVDAAAAEQPLARRVHDGVHLEGGDVGLDDADPVHVAPRVRDRSWAKQRRGPAER
jgi:hypothetical protein